MEDNKLTRKNCIFSRRRGSALPLALVVVLIGSAVVAMMFQTSGSYVGTTSQQRKPYSDSVVAASYIEQAKGEILYDNINIENGINRGSHASDNAPITNINQLIISKFNHAKTEVTDAGRRDVKVTVYDANYDTERIKFSNPKDFEDLPPSFFFNTSNVVVKDPPPIVDTTTSDKYGAYLVRVEISNIDAPTGTPVRITEEAFLHRLPD